MTRRRDLPLTFTPRGAARGPARRPPVGGRLRDQLPADKVRLIEEARRRAQGRRPAPGKPGPMRSGTHVAKPGEKAADFVKRLPYRIVLSGGKKWHIHPDGRKVAVRDSSGELLTAKKKRRELAAAKARSDVKAKVHNDYAEGWKPGYKDPNAKAPYHRLANKRRRRSGGYRAP